MNKIILFRGRSEMPASGKATPLSPAGAQMLRFQPKPSRRSSTFVLRAMWRRDPKSGRLECRWLRGIASETDAGHRRDAVTLLVVVAAAPRRSLSLLR